MTNRVVRAALAACVVAGAVAAVPASAATPRVACTGDPRVVHSLDVKVKGTVAHGLYAVPRGRARGVIAFAHGNGKTSEHWRRYISRMAVEHRMIAFAMDYRFQRLLPRVKGKPRSSRGWRVAEGAEDSVAVTQLFDKTCGRLGANVMYGTSMGGNTAGLAAAARATRPSGGPLFDFLFLIESVSNVTETYYEARGVAQSGNKTAVNAVTDIEEEMGGTFEEKSDVYLQRSVVTRADDIRASGIQGVVLVHDIDDGQAGYNQTDEMAAELHRAGVAADVFHVLTRGSEEEDTTLDEYVLNNVPGQPNGPLAGHAAEESETHVVIRTGFARLAALLERGEVPHCRDFVVDGTTKTTTPDPASNRGTC
ncbi:MAG: alpha/beta hydrolase family protein [Mycobacteriales bacterium]|nr:hypothetical protein [Frankia sp.]